ncbi:ABC transporter substrate-binding protein [Haemophilus influenzae]
MRKLLKTLLGMTALLAHSVLFAASHNGYTTVDWAVAETLIALGEPPLAVGDMQSYQTWVKQPELPKTTVNLGVRLQPNLELIATLSHSADDLNLVFINSNFYASLNNLLRPYAQVHNVDFYQAGDAWQNVLNATRTIGQIIGKPQAVQQLLAQYEQDVQRLKTELSAFTDRPLAFLPAIYRYPSPAHLRRKQSVRRGGETTRLPQRLSVEGELLGVSEYRNHRTRQTAAEHSFCDRQTLSRQHCQRAHA